MVRREIRVLLQELVERAVEVQDGLLVAQGPDARRHLPDELLVVGDDEGRALVPPEPVRKRRDGLEVEVVRRLVEHEHVVPRAHEVRHEQAHRLAAGEGRGGLHPLLTREEHPAEQPGDLLVRELVLELAQPAERGRAGPDEPCVVLREVADGRLVPPLHLAAVRRERADQELHQGRLADPVLADDGDLLALRDERVEGPHDLAPSVALLEVLDRQGLPPRRLRHLELDERRGDVGALQVLELQLVHRASQVQSRIRAMDKLKLEDLKRSNIAAPFIKFEVAKPSGRQTLTVEDLQKSYGRREIVRPFNALVTKGEKVAIIGKNGVGKSTLVQLLVGALPPDRGEVKWGHQATVGYLPQDHAGLIRPGTTAFGWLRELEDKLSNEEISGLLGRMLFSGEERMKPTATLSGGETVRLLMSNLMRTRDNVLVLDEPTNHLDLQAIASLADGLGRYEGTAFIVTHDQQLIGEVATRIWALRDEEPILDFNGTFDEFLEKHPDLAAHHR